MCVLRRCHLVLSRFPQLKPHRLLAFARVLKMLLENVLSPMGLIWSISCHSSFKTCKYQFFPRTLERIVIMLCGCFVRNGKFQS